MIYRVCSVRSIMDMTVKRHVVVCHRICCRSTIICRSLRLCWSCKSSIQCLSMSKKRIRLRYLYREAVACRLSRWVQGPRRKYLHRVSGVLGQSASGSDSGDGSQAHPFRTVTRAQTAVQALKKAHDDHVPAPGVVVNVASGTYDFSDAPLQFTSEDSGEAAAIVTYRGSD
eukprot:scpid100929/ scgid3403/ 